jgi:hypothetical protein
MSWSETVEVRACRVQGRDPVTMHVVMYEIGRELPPTLLWRAHAVVHTAPPTCDAACFVCIMLHMAALSWQVRLHAWQQ